jgi:arylsulfatase
VLDGKPAYCYNLFGAQQFKVYSDIALDPGEHQVRVEFDYDGGGYGKGGNVTLFLDGTQVGAGRVDGTVPMIFSLDETTDIGRDTATSVTDDLSVEETAFKGGIQWIQIDVGDDAKDADNYISAEERFRIAMAIQ